MKNKRRQKTKLIIGLTGGFCSGKSTARLLFKEFGAKTFDCDKAAHDSLKKNSPIYKKIVKTFGRKILSTSGQINRKKLGAIVFKNKKQRKKLEAIVHPFVVKKIKDFVKKHKGLLIIEVPLLFEAKLEKSFEYIVVVSCSQKELLARAKKRFPFLSHAKIRQRIKSQLSLGHKKKRADFIIHNTKPKQVVRQIGEIVFFLKSELKKN